MDADVLPKIRMSVVLESTDGAVTATAVIDGLDTTYRASASAPYRPAAPTESAKIGPDLAVARVLHELYHDVMERVHERIDRSYGDI